MELRSRTHVYEGRRAYSNAIMADLLQRPHRRPLRRRRRSRAPQAPTCGSDPARRTRRRIPSPRSRWRGAGRTDDHYCLTAAARPRYGKGDQAVARRDELSLRLCRGSGDIPRIRTPGRPTSRRDSDERGTCDRDRSRDQRVPATTPFLLARSRVGLAFRRQPHHARRTRPTTPGGGSFGVGARRRAGVARRHLRRQGGPGGAARLVALPVLRLCEDL